MASPTVHHLCEVSNVAHCAKQHGDLKVCLKPLPVDSLRLVCHSDAAWANVGIYTKACYILGLTDDRPDKGLLTDSTPAV